MISLTKIPLLCSLSFKGDSTIFWWKHVSPGNKIYIKVWSLLDCMFTNVVVRCKIRHFLCREKLQSKVSKHKVWCEIINAFRTVSILHTPSLCVGGLPTLGEIRGLGLGLPPAGSRGRAPGQGIGGQSPQKLKVFCFTIK